MIVSASAHTVFVHLRSWAVGQSGGGTSRHLGGQVVDVLLIRYTAQAW